jgi:hypothetical protein
MESVKGPVQNQLGNVLRGDDVLICVVACVVTVVAKLFPLSKRARRREKNKPQGDDSGVAHRASPNKRTRRGDDDE